MDITNTENNQIITVSNLLKMSYEQEKSRSIVAEINAQTSELAIILAGVVDTYKKIYKKFGNQPDIEETIKQANAIAKDKLMRDTKYTLEEINDLVANIIK